MAVKDTLGNDITEGCEIVYASLLGRSAALSRGRVLKVEERQSTGPTYEGDKYRIKIQRLNNDGSDIQKRKFVYDPDNTNGGSRFEDAGPSTSTLKFPSRIVVVKSA